MTEDEFIQWINSIRNREKVLDGNCKNEIVLGRFSRHLMERTGLYRYAGINGKTRIVIEFDNDTGKGWKRVVTEDPATIATQKYHSDSQ